MQVCVDIGWIERCFLAQDGLGYPVRRSDFALKEVVA